MRLDLLQVLWSGLVRFDHVRESFAGADYLLLRGHNGKFQPSELASLRQLLELTKPP